MSYTDQTATYVYKLLLTYQLMDQLAENDAMMIRTDLGGQSISPASAVSGLIISQTQAAKGIEIRNTGAAAASLIIQQQTATTTNDALVTYNTGAVAGTDRFSLGVDYSDTNVFKLCLGGALVAANANEVLSVDTSGNVVINQSSADHDFIVETDGNANMLNVNGGENAVGIGKVPTAGVELDVNGDIACLATGKIYLDGGGDTYIQESAGNTFEIYSGAAQIFTATATTIVFNENSADIDFRIESNNNANILFVDGGKDAVAIGTNVAGHTMIAGDTALTIRGRTAGYNAMVELVVNIADFGSAGGELTFLNADNTGAANLVHARVGAQTAGTTANNRGAMLYFQTKPDGGALTIAMILNANRTVQMTAYGAGTATFDASGNISSVSDERLKNIKSNFTRGIVDLLKLTPVVYAWKSETGYDTLNDYIGFTAQNVKAAMPEAVLCKNKTITETVNGKTVSRVEKSTEGDLHYSLHAIIGALVNSVKELNNRIKTLEGGK